MYIYIYIYNIYHRSSHFSNLIDTHGGYMFKWTENVTYTFASRPAIYWIQLNLGGGLGQIVTVTLHQPRFLYLYTPQLSTSLVFEPSPW